MKSYDPKKESKHIMYLDVNNFFGYTLKKYPPASGFEWTDPKDFDLNKCTNNSSKGCVLKVDLEYPKELHELHNGNPLAPDKIEIKRARLFEYQLKIADLCNIPIGNVKKLVPNSVNKEEYVIRRENHMSNSTHQKE